MAFGRKNRGPDSTLDLQILIFTIPRAGMPFPCVITGQGDASMIPYLPAVYLDKILSNLRSERDEAARLLDRVANHLVAIQQAIGETEEEANLGFEQAAFSTKAAVVEEAPESTTKAGRIISNFYINHSKRRFGAITHMKDGSANSASAEIGFWAIWNWGCGRNQRDGWTAMSKQVAALIETVGIYNEQGILTPKMLDIGKVPYRVCEAFEAAEAGALAAPDA